MLSVPIIQAVTFWLFLCHPSPETLTTIIVDGVGSQEQMIKAPKITLKRKLSLLPGLLKYMMPLALVYFFEYFINQGLVSNENNSLFTYRGAYQLDIPIY